MTPDLDIYRAASVIIMQYGEDAPPRRLKMLAGVEPLLDRLPLRNS